jgi:hypothetical protein
LEYSSQEDVVYFFGPTRIYNKENYVYCEKGWSNRKNGQSNFLVNAILEKGAQKLYGQDVFYDKKAGFARIIKQVALVDTTRKVSVYGGKANYWDNKKEAEVLENPLLLMVSNGDTLFLRADKFLVNTYTDSTLKSSAIQDSTNRNLIQKDSVKLVLTVKDSTQIDSTQKDSTIQNSIKRDSTYRIVRALGATRFFKRDLQGLCDSLIYNTKDSTISMFVKPVLWNEGNQLTADFVKGYVAAENKLRRMEFEGTSFITSREDTLDFNQIRGKSMVGYFTDGKLSKLDVKGNGQAVYFLKDEGRVAAVNKAESTDLIVRIKDNKISKISFNVKPVSTFYPIKKVDYEEITLKDFKWLEDKRPKTKYDIIPNGLDLVLTDAKPWFVRDIKVDEDKTTAPLP